MLLYAPVKTPHLVTTPTWLVVVVGTSVWAAPLFITLASVQYMCLSSCDVIGVVSWLLWLLFARCTTQLSTISSSFPLAGMGEWCGDGMSVLVLLDSSVTLLVWRLQWMVVVLGVGDLVFPLCVPVVRSSLESHPLSRYVDWERPLFRDCIPYWDSLGSACCVKQNYM